MTQTEQHVFNAIAQIQIDKSTKRTAPYHAMMLEVFERLRDYNQEEILAALRSLARSKKITYGDTVNGIYFKISENEK